MSYVSHRYEDASGLACNSKNGKISRSPKLLPAKHELNDFVLLDRFKYMERHASYAADPNFLFLGGSFRQLDRRDGRS
jgi:hypothetical protein